MYAEYSLTHLRYLKTVFLILNLFVARFSDALYSGPENPLYLNAHTICFQETIYKLIQKPLAFLDEPQKPPQTSFLTSNSKKWYNRL